MRLLFLSIVLICICSCKSLAACSFSISSGTGLDESLLQSGNIGSTSANGLLFNTLLTDNFNIFEFEFDLFLEFGGYQLKGKHLDLDEKMNIFHIKPKLRLDLGSDVHLDVGLGLASLSEDHWEEIRFSGKSQFSLSVGVGWLFGSKKQLSLDLVYNHYSNGYTRSPNPGIDYVTLNLGYNFD